MTSSIKPVATAILAVYNSASTIEACLQSLLSQSVPLEIIVVDDGSTDHTGVSINRIIDTPSRIPIKLLNQAHQGPAIARNLGAKHAHTNILLFVDADVVFDRDYVKVLIAPLLANPNLAARTVGTYTSQEKVANWDNVWARCWNKQEGWEDGMRFPPNPPKYGTDFRAILKSKFDQVGGFDNLGYTDTWSLHHKLKVAPLKTEAICYHHNPSSLTLVFRQARWLAKRPYKWGILGTLLALIRTCPPISLIVAPVLAIFHKMPALFIFKLVYDFGRFIGLLEYIFTPKLAK